jgi:hypothetical protein
LVVVDDYPGSICLSKFAELIPQSKSKLQRGHNQPAEDTRMCPARTISQSAVCNPKFARWSEIRIGITIRILTPLLALPMADQQPNKATDDLEHVREPAVGYDDEAHGTPYNMGMISTTSASPISTLFLTSIKLHRTHY